MPACLDGSSARRQKLRGDERVFGCAGPRGCFCRSVGFPGTASQCWTRLGGGEPVLWQLQEADPGQERLSEISACSLRIEYKETAGWSLAPDGRHVTFEF